MYTESDTISGARTQHFKLDSFLQGTELKVKENRHVIKSLQYNVESVINIYFFHQTWW